VFILLQLAAIVLGAEAMLLRISGRPVWESVFAEDPGIFLPWALGHPWHLLEPYAGYLQLVPRLIGQVAALVPIRDASVAFAVGGALVASACALFTYHASAGQVSSRWLRALLGLSVLLLPVAPLEIADTGVETPWYLLAVLFWAALWRPRSRAGSCLAALVAFAAATTNLLALALAPLFAARVVALPRRSVREHAATLGWALGCVLQLVVSAGSHQSRFLPPKLLYPGLYYVHDVLLPALGWHLAWFLRDALGLAGASALMGGLIAVVLAAGLATRIRRYTVFLVTAVLTGLVITGVTAAFSWGGPGRDSPGLEGAIRFATVPILLLVAALIVLADTCARRWRPQPKAVVAVTVLAAVLAVGWVTDFRYPVVRFTATYSDWSVTADQWLRYCQHKPTGTITVSFPNFDDVLALQHGEHPVGNGMLYNSFSCSSLRR
jgi:hypothetical protein